MELISRGELPELVKAMGTGALISFLGAWNETGRAPKVKAGPAVEEIPSNEIEGCGSGSVELSV